MFSNYLRNIGKYLFNIYIIYFERFLITKLILRLRIFKITSGYTLLMWKNHGKKQFK